MQLYYAPGTISVVVAIALEETGAEYTPVAIDFSNKEQTKSAYAQINPKGRVPALAFDGGILTETGALLEYIADQSPAAELRPTGPLLAARMREVMYYLASTMHVNHAHKQRGSRWATKPVSYKDMKAMVPQTMTASCEYISQNGLRGPFVLGETFSMADCYLYVVCTWLTGDGVDLDKFPKIRNFMETMEARPSVRAIYAKGML
ncbi:MAG: glutathione S-transferase family protein [Paracoccaceae bacterium]|jgi:glutathione S-transferase